MFVWLSNHVHAYSTGTGSLYLQLQKLKTRLNRISLCIRNLDEPTTRFEASDAPNDLPIPGNGTCIRQSSLTVFHLTRRKRERSGDQLEQLDSSNSMGNINAKAGCLVFRIKSVILICDSTKFKFAPQFPQNAVLLFYHQQPHLRNAFLDATALREERLSRTARRRAKFLRDYGVDPYRAVVRSFIDGIFTSHFNASKLS